MAIRTRSQVRTDSNIEKAKNKATAKPKPTKVPKELTGASAAAIALTTPDKPEGKPEKTGNESISISDDEECAYKKTCKKEKMRNMK
jgi:hypothetical protein